MSTFIVPEGHKISVYKTQQVPFALTDRLIGGFWRVVTGYDSDLSDEEIPKVLADLCPPPQPVELPARETPSLSHLLENPRAPTHRIASGTVLVIQPGSLAGWTSTVARLEQLVAGLQAAARQTTLVVYGAKHDELFGRVAPLLRGAGIDVRSPGERDETIIAVERPDGSVVSVLVGPRSGEPNAAPMSPRALRDAIARTARPELVHRVPIYSPLMNRLLSAVLQNHTPSTLGALLDHLVVRRYGVGLMSRRTPSGESGVAPMRFPEYGDMFAVYSNQTSFGQAVQETHAEADWPNVQLAAMSIPTLVPWAASRGIPIALCICAAAPGGGYQPHYVPICEPELGQLAARLSRVSSSD